MSVKMQTTCTWTKRPFEASLFPEIDFGPFLRSLGGRRERPPSRGGGWVTDHLSNFKDLSKPIGNEDPCLLSNFPTACE
ncbi:hypothetical protein H5410_023996 [Solanum commersonii]|uniref:Uncharacterized protein n=1 Tax=Solanum commersonii TaxID=4109 RepID=A0A9J5ZKQ1_SOLCO|nr:hypothetical protein H5410_023996 [Solanum commersonii]